MFTDFVSKLEELALVANLENVEINDYKLFRIIAGLNDPRWTDKILSIPLQDFTLEEVKRVGVHNQTAKNYSGLNPTHRIIQVTSKRNHNSFRKSGQIKNSGKTSYPNPSTNSSTQNKLKSLRQKNALAVVGNITKVKHAWWSQQLATNVVLRDILLQYLHSLDLNQLLKK